MSQWNLAKYTKLCTESNWELKQDEYFSDQTFGEVAESLLNIEPGLEDWIRESLLKGIDHPDVVGCLTDDLAYPENCREYIWKIQNLIKS